MSDSRLNIAFAPWMVAGVQSQWESMRPYVAGRTDVSSHVVEIHPYRHQGFIESIPVVPPIVKGTIRSMMSASALLSLPRLDALWLQSPRNALPYLLTRARWDATQVVVSVDATANHLASFGDYYATTSPPDSLRGRMRQGLESLWENRVQMILPWSEWVARSLREDDGIPADRIRVMPPGIDLDRWPYTDRHVSETVPVRLLFVGGDFRRKGGDLLLDAFSRHFADRCELHLITRDDVPDLPNVYVYRNLSPNDPKLRALYAESDVFVLPTRADCSPIALVEAMATGLPALTTCVGGIPEMVQEGRSGYLIQPDDGTALRERLETLIAAPERRRSMGAEGRRTAESRYDAAQNTTQALDLLVDLARHRKRLGQSADIRRV